MLTKVSGDLIGQNTVTNQNIAASVQDAYGWRNRIINGDMRIAQRGTAAVTTNPAFPVDRFSTQNGTDGAYSAQQDSSAPPGFVNSLKYTTTTADGTLTGTQNSSLLQRIEGTNFADLGWGTANAQTVTLSFWVRSSLTGTFGGSLRNADNTRSHPYTYTINAADTWEQKSVTIVGDTSGTWLTTTGTGVVVIFGLGAGPDISGTPDVWASTNYVSTTGAVSVIGTLNATWFITGVQLEVGSAATAFERRDYGRELVMCQRYYIEVGVRNASGTDVFPLVRWGASLLATSFNTPVTMRATPTGTLTSTYRATGNGTNPSLTAISSVTTVTNTGVAIVYSSSIDPSDIQPYVAIGASATSKTALSAEL